MELPTKNIIKHIFVYGTLMQGMENPVKDVLTKYLTFIGFATINADLYDMGSYPGAIPTITGKMLDGEVYELDAHNVALGILDNYEGYDEGNIAESEFVRGEIEVKLFETKTVSAWIYWLNKTYKNKGIKISNRSYRSYLKYKKD